MVVELWQQQLRSGMCKLLLNWMEGEFSSGYCINKGKAIGKLWGISNLLGKVISLLIAEDVYVSRYP
ncbi:hypothetical protein TNCV_2618271 [Trichonephila clavipes]|nr:hypothetical protein TNCV_2618271 [Trichonephila clavipes]